MVTTAEEYYKFTPEQKAEYERKQKYIGLMGGAVIGSVVGIGLNLFTKWKAPVLYRSATFRTAAFIMPFIECAHVGADYRLHHAIFEERGVYKAAERRIDATPKTTTEKILAFGSENRLKIIFGAWLASLAGSGYLVWQDKYLTRAQKIVQVRMYAQGITVALIVISALGSMNKAKDEPVYILDPKDKEHHHYIHNPHTGSKHNDAADHWKMVLEEQQDRKS